LTVICPPRHYDHVTTPFDDPQAELAWMFLQNMWGEGGDIDEGMSLLSDDFTYWSIISGTSFDKETLRAAIEHRKSLLPGVSIDLIRCVNEGETVVIEGNVEGTTTAGAWYETPFVCIFDTRDGQIVSIREYSDTRAATAIFPPSTNWLEP
jgi:ketosteroid isomerase-like protein